MPGVELCGRSGSEQGLLESEKKKVGVIMDLHSEIIGQEKPYRAIKTEQCMEMIPKLRINYPYKVRLDGNFG